MTAKRKMEPQRKALRVPGCPNRYEYRNPDSKSVTVPDDALSVKQILERHTRGFQMPMRNLAYGNSGSFDEIDQDAIARFDLIDRSETLEFVNERIAKEKLEKQAKAKRDELLKKQANEDKSNSGDATEEQNSNKDQSE